LFRHFAAFADGFRNFHGFAETQSNFSLAVSSNDQGAEAETATAFDDLGGAVDENDLLGQFRTVF
jgi:hypothetical protein